MKSVLAVTIAIISETNTFIDFFFLFGLFFKPTGEDYFQKAASVETLTE